MQSCSQNKVQVVGGFLHIISVQVPDFPRRKRKVANYSKSSGLFCLRRFSSEQQPEQVAREGIRKNIKEKENEQTSPSKESEVPSRKRLSEVHDGKDEGNEDNLSQKALSTVSDARDAAVGTVEGDMQLETTETIVVGEIESSDIDDGKDEDNEENLSQKALSTRNLSR
nr:starch synthase 3, chloroplastic/amyloplastic isoform X2 [Ipomoea batatas]